MFVVLFEIAVDKGRIDRSRTNTISADLFGIVHGQLPGHRDNGSLRGAIGEPPLYTNQTGYGTDVHNRAMGLNQQRERATGHQERPFDVDAHQFLKISSRSLVNASHQPDPGIVYQNVELLYSGEHLLDALLVGYVTYPNFGAGYFHRQMFSPFPIQIDDDDFRSSRRENLGRGGTDATGATGDQGHPAVQTKQIVHVHSNCNLRPRRSATNFRHFSRS